MKPFDFPGSQAALFTNHNGPHLCELVSLRCPGWTDHVWVRYPDEERGDDCWMVPVNYVTAIGDVADAMLKAAK